MSEEFLYKKNIRMFQKFQNKIYRQDLKLNYEVVKRGLVLPLTEKENCCEQSGGVINSEGKLVMNSLTLRTNPFDNWKFYSNWFIGLKNSLYTDFDRLKVQEKKVVYLGAFPAHYGHFIFEGLSRVWIKKFFNPNEYLFIYISILNKNSHLLEILSLLGIPDSNILKIDRPTKFKEIIIPEPSIRLNDYYFNEFKESVAFNYKNKQNHFSKKIFFTRYNKNGRSFGHSFIEKFMQRNGYEIINPENYSLVNICKVLENCSHFASTSGTNMANSIFLPEGSKIICFNRSSHVHPLQIMIDKMMDFDAQYVDCHLNFPKINFSSGPYFFWPSNEFFKFSNRFHKNNIKVFIFFSYLCSLIKEILYYLIIAFLRKIKNLILYKKKY